MSATTMNGRQRKSLAEQIDRLDSTLDGLADGLNEAVATAVQEAVRAVLTEVFTHPEFLARLAVPSAMAPGSAVPPGSTGRPRTWERVREACRWLGQQIVTCRAPLDRTCAAGWNQVNEAGRRVGAKALQLVARGGMLLRTHRWGPVLAAVALGGMTGMAGRYLGPWVAAGVGGAGGLALALSSSVGPTWLARTWLWRTQTD